MQTQNIMPHTCTHKNKRAKWKQILRPNRNSVHLFRCWAFVNGIDQTTDLEIKLGAHLAFFVRIHVVCYSVYLRFFNRFSAFSRSAAFNSFPNQFQPYIRYFFVFGFWKSSFLVQWKFLHRIFTFTRNAVNVMHFR